MKALLGLILNMATIPQKIMEEYFSLHFTNMIPLFSTIFNRERFLQVFWMLHLNENLPQNNSLRTRTQKANSYIGYLDSKFRENFVPDKKICVDESVVKFKGRSSFITYNPNKPAKWWHSTSRCKYGLRMINITLLWDSCTRLTYSSRTTDKRKNCIALI